MTTIPLNLLDELYLTLDRETEPWTVHYEVCLGTHLDSDRLAGAVVAAARRHPLARAQLTRWRFQDRRYDWEIADELSEIPLTVMLCDEPEKLEQERERFFSTSPSLTTAPPFAIGLARCPQGDSLLLNLHHAAGDGISAERFMLSILRAYTGHEDPVPPLDPLALHDVGALAAARSARGRSARRRALSTAAWRPLIDTARVAREGDDHRPAYGFELLALSPEESLKLFARHGEGRTVNDVLLAALAVAIVRWNSEHGRRPGPIALSMPVNLRPPEWRHEIFSNFASWVTVWISAEADDDLDLVARRVAVRTRAIKREGLGGMAVDLLRVSRMLTIANKRWLQYLRIVMSDLLVDTASLSNLSRIEPMPPPFDGPDTEVWFSPPSQMPLGVGIGVVTIGDRLHVTMRYRHSQFDRAAARRLIELDHPILVE